MILINQENKHIRKINLILNGNSTKVEVALNLEI